MKKTRGGPARPPLGGDDLADVEEQFDDCDANGDARIELAEFSQLLDNLGADLPPAQRRKRFEELDTNRDGAIDRAEFMEWWRGR